MDGAELSRLIDHLRHIQHNLEVRQITLMQCAFRSTPTYQVGLMHRHRQIRMLQESAKVRSFQRQKAQQK